MPVLRLENFAGVIPVKGDRALPPNAAAESFNTWLYGSELRGVRPPIDLIAVNAGIQKVMRIPKRTPGGDDANLFPGGTVPPPSYLGDSVWKTFTDPFTDVVKGSMVKDKYERYYFCSPSLGPSFNTYDRMLNGQSDFKLGVVGPNTVVDANGNNADKPVIGAPTGGAAPVVTRAWCYTWANEFGEESAPSLPALAAGNTGAIFPISNIKDPPSGAIDPRPDGYPAYTKKYLYRTLAGGENNFYRVNEIPIGTTTYNDDTSKQTDSVITNNLILESTYWGLPPATLQGWIGMPNGFLVAFDKPTADGLGNYTGGNTVYMCEPYHFHAWPPQYQYATETPIVGLGVIGQTCVICTQGYPATIQGVKPASAAFTKANTGEPCLSRGSIVSTPQGVVYASQNGLISIGPGGIMNVTEQLITKEEWSKSYYPQYLRASRYQNGYLALRTTPTGTVPAFPPRSGFFIDPTALQVALTEFSDFTPYVNVQTDFWSGEVFLLKSLMIMRWDPPTSDLMPVRWLSKEFQFPYEENFGAYAVYWDDTRYSNYNYGTSIMPTTEKVRLKVWANRVVVYDQVVPKNGRPVRLPSGFKADIWQFEIRARAPVYSLHVASTVKELRAV